MKRLIIAFVVLIHIFFPLKAQLTLEKCQEMARENYPLIKKYKLIEKTLDIELNDINKSWLPGISLFGQGTIQNYVPAFPSALTGLLEQMGQEMEGIDKLQYKFGIDLNQPIWDGGSSKARRDVARTQEALQQSYTDLEMYNLRQKIDNLYFAALLTEKQIEQSRITLKLLILNLEIFKIRFQKGFITKSDLDMLIAQSLTLKQNIIQAESSLKGYKKLIGLYIGEDITKLKLQTPSPNLPNTLTSARPEFNFFENKRSNLEAMQRLSDTSVMPKIGLFAQAYYGYPGFDYFKSMINYNLSFNVLAGVRLSWNLDSFYTRKNNKIKTSFEIEKLGVDRELFLFESNLRAKDQLEKLDGLSKVIKEDGQIVELRSNIRKAEEAKLKKGIVDTNSLLSKIAEESSAQLNAKLHEIQYIKEVYQLRNILNR